MKKVNNIYFSPTFSTKKVVETVGETISDEIFNLDLSNKDEDYSKYEFSENEICVVGVPSFGGRVPSTARDRISKLKANNTPCVIIATYGNRAYEDTLIELKDILNNNGFNVFAAMGVVCEHSIMNEFAKGRPDENDINEIKDYAVKIKEKIENNNIEEIEVPGNNPYRKYSAVPMVPKAGKNCIKCGKCAAECPVGAIDFNEPDKTDKDKCISCMRCIKVCDYNARSLNKVMLMAARKKLKKACEGRKENELFI
ncbi:EFR1 family ferrodoxin [Anaerofustis sp. NSJ-163]|uniref:EFR1 family ferrodoxin n=1 Tax=Anaerofustis sp. NSJ-163 TaxID=2944391 RepID=UPI00209C0935|nr:EFR1 family ferrodoxin [Anaerofustis sp. NSJ-163]MCO8193617.1 EFR1 family ferrodoxin [Anaerofustis sp. NSJ-163]